jgi:hypothetical protein
VPGPYIERRSLAHSKPTGQGFGAVLDRVQGWPVASSSHPTDQVTIKPRNPASAEARFTRAIVRPMTDDYKELPGVLPGHHRVWVRPRT